MLGAFFFLWIKFQANFASGIDIFVEISLKTASLSAAGLCNRKVLLEKAETGLPFKARLSFRGRAPASESSDPR